MKAENTTKIQFDSLSVNESYARGAAAAFLARYDPTVSQLAALRGYRINPGKDYSQFPWREKE